MLTESTPAWRCANYGRLSVAPLLGALPFLPKRGGRRAARTLSTDWRATLQFARKSDKFAFHYKLSAGKNKPNETTLIAAVIALTLLASAANVVSLQRPGRASSVYYPAAGDSWQRKSPSQAGFDAALIEQAVAFAKTQETKVPRDFSTQVQTFGALLGPMPKQRGETNGIVLRHGYIVAEWGDTRRIDPTYSVAKSLLTTVLGLTIDRGMIRDIDDLVGGHIKDGGYDSPQNSKVRWRHHANQSSEW